MTRALAERLGLPGFIDIHTHFLPPQVMRKVRAQFDAAGPLIGHPWPLHYRDTDKALVELLHEFGVHRFTALPYAHRAEMAEWLNDWADGFARRTPGALVCGTFFPEPGVADYVAARISTVQVFKVHVQVGGFGVLDPMLDKTWGLLADARTPVVVHAGSGPVATPHTGPEPVAALMARHPDLRLVIAHAGAPEYADFLALAERYDGVCLDTTMAFTDFFERELNAPYPRELRPRLGELGLAGRVLLGSDFPNIPYPYSHQLDALERLDLGDDWLRAVCHDNAAAILGDGVGVPGAER